MGVPFEIPNDINISGSVEGKVYMPKQDKPENLLFNCLQRGKKLLFQKILPVLKSALMLDSHEKETSLTEKDVLDDEDEKIEEVAVHERPFEQQSCEAPRLVFGGKDFFVTVMAAALFILPATSAAPNIHSADQTSIYFLTSYETPTTNWTDCLKFIANSKDFCINGHGDIKSCIFDNAGHSIWPVCVKKFEVPAKSCPLMTFLKDLGKEVVVIVADKCPSCDLKTLEERMKDGGEACFRPTTITTTRPPPTSTDSQRNAATRMGPSVMLIGLCALVILLCSTPSIYNSSYENTVLSTSYDHDVVE